ncbi:MAG: BON domain-containing protein [Phaeospirillum sp.]|nr:BON domain-containing protein [Phaeospirillum sp.]
MRRIASLIAAAGAVMVATPARAQFMDILTAPKTLIERAVEARSVSDIAKDNAIVVKVNAAMARQGAIKASTEIYEQRLLVTGLFDDRATHDAFQRDVKAVEGVRKLYWHVTYLAENDPRRETLPSWSDTLAIAAKAQLRLTKAAGGKYVNFRVTGDSYGNLYVIGRAYTKEEAADIVAALREGDGVKKVVSTIEIRP